MVPVGSNGGWCNDQVKTGKSEDKLQMAVRELNKNALKYDLKMAPSKKKTIRLCCKT
jgi:anti-sigma regulatory factor (Ser/Thr protein kinase)